MAPRMRDLEEADGIFRAEKAKFTGALSTVAGSRWTTAIAASLALSFGVTWFYFPNRLPHLSGVNWSTFGLPDNLDFGVVGEQAKEAAEAAARQGAGEAAAEFVAKNAELIPTLNGVGFGVCLAALLGNMYVMTQRRRITRG